MLPQATFTDTGEVGTGNTIYGGPYTGPDTVLESGLSFLDITEDVILADAICQLATGAAPANQHGFLISVNDVTAVVGQLYSTQIPPNSNLRTAPRYKFKRGDRVFIRGVQLSGGSAEATQLILQFKH
jgi:hypothetical protein